jgi:hypothetical protein
MAPRTAVKIQFSFYPTFLILNKKLKGSIWDHLAICVSPNSWKVDRSGKLLLASPAQSLLVSGSVGTVTAFLFVLRPLICFEMGPPLQWEEGFVFLQFPLSRAVICSSPSPAIVLFLKVGKCPFYLTSSRTSEKTPTQTLRRVVFYAVRLY